MYWLVVECTYPRPILVIGQDMITLLFHLTSLIFCYCNLCPPFHRSLPALELRNNCSANGLLCRPVWYDLMGIIGNICQKFTCRYSHWAIQAMWFDSSLPVQKDRHFADDHSKRIFMNEKSFYIDSNFTEIYSQGSNWQFCSIGLSNGLAPNRRHAITRTNANPVHRRIYAVIGGDEITNEYATHYA